MVVREEEKAARRREEEVEVRDEWSEGNTGQAERGIDFPRRFRMSMLYDD